LTKNTGLTVLKELYRVKSGCKHQNILCGPDSPLFALPQISHLVTSDWLSNFLLVEIYYFTRTLKKFTKKTGSTMPKKFKCKSGCKHQNIFCGPDSPLFVLSLISYLVTYDWWSNFLMVEIYYFTRKLKHWPKTQDWWCLKNLKV